ncbi:class I glutamine amidotransferase-like protein [Sphaerosporella brunnea]|uniref:Class I glutamine amidotransferase-like protein n=1 Tax=Sphaerosporella brunnea TaxID=1250544 RepID=A0A5J5EZG4_9PEZI|nr:class I glutamine amidotransferase-like protein [Sphaerosporella brunnea]
MPTVYLLDTVSGNIRSLVNAIERVGYTVEWIKSPSDLETAESVIFPGVGHFGHCMSTLSKAGYIEPLKRFIASGKPFYGHLPYPGLGVIQGKLKLFDSKHKKRAATRASPDGSLYGLRPHSKYYYVHSYARPVEGLEGWDLATAKYGDEEGNIMATQFHPEKSGYAGLAVLKAFLTQTRLTPLSGLATEVKERASVGWPHPPRHRLPRRAHERRTGDLVVTKGDQYDVREKADQERRGAISASRFRNCPVRDLPMLEVLRRHSETVTSSTRTSSIVLRPRRRNHVLQERADKVSIGSDAVTAAEEFYARGKTTPRHRGDRGRSRKLRQPAVVVSVDPRRVYVSAPSATPRNTHQDRLSPVPTAEAYWLVASVPSRRARGSRPRLACRCLVQAVEAMGAGEILLNWHR